LSQIACEGFECLLTFFVLLSRRFGQIFRKQTHETGNYRSESENVRSREHPADSWAQASDGVRRPSFLIIFNVHPFFFVKLFALADYSGHFYYRHPPRPLPKTGGGKEKKGGKWNEKDNRTPAVVMQRAVA
jgi:hypothetical protein